MDYEVIQGRIFYRGEVRDLTLLLNSRGKIKDIKQGLLPTTDKVLKIPRSCIALPGIIDIHVHFRDWELSSKETIDSGSKAALYGGVTLVCDMPNTKPPIRSLSRVKERLELAKVSTYCDYWLYAGVPENSEEIRKLSSSKLICGFKIYPEDLKLIVSSEEIRSKFREVDNLIVLHPEMWWCDERCLHQVQGNRYVCRSGAQMVLAVKLIKSLLGRSQRIHITHVPYLDVISLAKAYGFTCDTCVHYLLLDSRFEELGCTYKVNPPLEPLTERLRLWRAIFESLVDAISTDHAPHTREDKMCDFNLCPSGIASIEVAYKILFTYVMKGILSLKTYVKLTSEKPAEILGIDRLWGSIDIGKYASLTVINPKEFARVHGTVFSKAGFTGFEGWSYQGEVVMTMIRGSIAYEKGVGFSRVGAIVPELI